MSNTNGKIVVVGSSNTDLVISTENFPNPGETIFGHNFMTNPGGKGANQAVAAARLGADTVFVAKLGSDSLGEQTLAHLRSEGVCVDGVSIAEGEPSGVALITTDKKGENTIVVGSGANSLLSVADIDAAEALFEDASIVLMQLETPIDTITRAAELGKKHGAVVVLNPAPAPKTPLPAELLKNVDILIPNETEAGYLSGIEVTDDASIASAMAELKKMGVGQVIMTLGSRGVCAEIDGKQQIVPSFKVEAVDTTAAGDTFCGALCVALQKGEPLEQAIRFANKAASISVTRRGAQVSMPHLNEVVL